MTHQGAGSQGNGVRTATGAIVVPPGAPVDENPDSLPPKTKSDLTGELTSDRDRRRLRNFAFAFFMGISGSFFYLLWGAFSAMLHDPKGLPGLLGALDSHSTIFLSLWLVLMVSVPVSMAFGLVKISADRQPNETPTPDWLPAHMRLLKDFTDLVKPSKSS